MRKYFLFFLQASIIGAGISISVGQSFLFLALITFLFQSKRKIHISPILYFGFGIFILYFLSSFYQFVFYNKQLIQKSSEFKDVFLFSAFILVNNLEREEVYKLKKTFLILIILITLEGILSVFSNIRLSRLITDLYKFNPNYRFAHHYGDILNIKLHIPIGLMNTHLTFGGILALLVPISFFEIFYSKKKIFYLFILILLVFVFLLNNARSAIIGTGISIIIGLTIFLIQENRVSKKLIKPFFISLIILILISTIIVQKTEIGGKILKPILGQEKHTDSGRTFIWHSSFSLIFKNPFFGVGAGNYNEEVIKERNFISQEKKELVFFNEVTQKGHAHNDFIHLFLVSGFLAPISYLTILFLVLTKLFNFRIPFKSKYFYFSIIGFYFAGSFQCYFQDDEVVILFWYLVGLFEMESFYDISHKIT